MSEGNIHILKLNPCMKSPVITSHKFCQPVRYCFLSSSALVFLPSFLSRFCFSLSIVLVFDVMQLIWSQNMIETKRQKRIPKKSELPAMTWT